MTRDLRTGVRRLALVRAGRFSIAIDGALVESVVQGPLELSPFPCVARHVLGAFASRGGPVPAIDLAGLLECSSERAAAAPLALAVVLRVESGTFAIAVDSVVGVAPVSENSLTAIERRSSQGAGLFTHLFSPADGGAPAVVLDLDAILRIDDLHTAVLSTTRGDVATRERTDVLPLVLLRAGETVFALDAAAVVHVERRSAADDLALRHPTVRGFHQHDGRHLAMVELLAVLGHAPSRRSGAGSHLVILGDGEGGGIAIIVDDIVALTRAQRGAIEPLAADAPESGPIVRGCLRDAAHGVLVVLAAEHLLSQATILVQRDAAHDAQAGAADATVQSHYMVYRAGGGLLASRLTDLAAVAQVPPDFVDLRRAGSPVVGVLSRLGRTVQLFDLGVLMGAPPLPRMVDQPVLIVEAEGTVQGFVAESVAFLRSATPSRIPSPGRRLVGIMPRFAEMIAIPSDGADRSATVLELRQLAERTVELAGNTAAGNTAVGNTAAGGAA